MGFGFLIAAQLADLLPVAVRFLLGIILLAQRLGDHPHFLPQVILPLIFVDLSLHTLMQLRFNLQRGIFLA